MSSAGTQLGSVLIPAHNEESVIARCIRALFDGLSPEEIEVVVVCNGCTDDTASVARATGFAIEVLELEEASKAAALRAGERVLTRFPRIYLDADVVLQGSVARALLAHLARGHVLAARPRLDYDTSRSSWVVQRYYRARREVPSLMGSLWGAGVYGLSSAGRTRFGDYPDVVADDLFVDQQFTNSEKAIIDGAPVAVVAPRRFSDLMKVMRRAYRGKRELREQEDGKAPADTTRSTLRDLARLAARKPSRLIDVAVYCTATVAARLLVVLTRSNQWERDDSSRGVEASR